MIISLDAFMQKKDSFLPIAKAGKLFFYPTDTIYGIGSIVTPATVDAITTFKQRSGNKYYSVIAPSFERIRTHFAVDDHIDHQRTEQTTLYGPLTILLPKKDSSFLAEIGDTEVIGVRWLQHPFQQFVAKLNEPFITTSANLSGTPPITSPEQLSAEQQKHLDLIIDAGVLDASSSTILKYGTREKIR